jgi:hypothetical protein
MQASIHELAKRNRKASVTSGSQWQSLAFWTASVLGTVVAELAGGQGSGCHLA